MGFPLRNAPLPRIAVKSYVLKTRFVIYCSNRNSENSKLRFQFVIKHTVKFQKKTKNYINAPLANHKYIQLI